MTDRRLIGGHRDRGIALPERQSAAGRLAVEIGRPDATTQGTLLVGQVQIDLLGVGLNGGVPDAGTPAEENGLFGRRVDRPLGGGRSIVFGQLDRPFGEGLGNLLAGLLEVDDQPLGREGATGPRALRGERVRNYQGLSLRLELADAIPSRGKLDLHLFGTQLRPFGGRSHYLRSDRQKCFASGGGLVKGLAILAEKEFDLVGGQRTQADARGTIPRCGGPFRCFKP